MNEKIAVLMVVLIVFFAGCTGNNAPDNSKQTNTQTDTQNKDVVQEQKKEIRIGVVAPITGSASVTGLDMWEASVLAAEEINAAGGVMVGGVPHKVTLVKGDDESSVQAGVAVVTKLITQENVDVLVGGFSSSITYADQVIAAEQKVPFVITGASSTVITHRTDIDTSYFFHHCPTTDDHAEAAMVFFNDVAKPQIYQKYNYSSDRKLRLALLLQDSKYGEGMLEGIKAAIKKYKMNVEIVANEKFKMGETDYRTVLTSIKASKPDAVYPVAFVNEQTLIVVQGRRDVGLNTIYLAVDCNDDPSYYKGSEKWSEYSILESRFGPYSEPGGAIKESFAKYKENFQKRWNVLPGMMGASTYDGIYVIVEAIKKAGTTDKAKVRDALASIEVPQRVEPMKDGVAKFSQDFKEAKFDLYVQQLVWDETAKETRPKIVWPANLKQTDFVLPEWYQPGA